MKKESHPIDDFFRESLRDIKVTPSRTARSRFLEEAGPTGGKSGNWFFRWYKMLIVGALLTASVLFYTIYSTKNTPAPIQVVSNPVPDNTSTSYPTINRSAVSTSLNSFTTYPSAINKLSAGSTVKRSPVSQKTELLSQNSSTVKSEEKFSVNQSPLNEVKVEKTAILPGEPKKQVNTETQAESKSRLPVVSETKVESLPVAVASNSGSQATPKPAVDVSGNSSNGSGQGKSDYPLAVKLPAWNFTSWFKYSLDWNLKGNDNKVVHTLSIEGTIRNGRFSLTSGAGISVTNGYHRYEVQYNDYLGHYNKLDSITFNWDQKHYNLVPSYHMTETKVWDSAVKLDSYQVEIRYELLRIPLLLGYDFINRGRFVLGMKTGAEMTLYINSSNLSGGEYTAGSNKLVSVNPMADDLSRTNFYFLANLSAACNLSKRIVFELEPQVKYLLNPADSKINATKQTFVPWIRTSLKIKL